MYFKENYNNYNHSKYRYNNISFPFNSLFFSSNKIVKHEFRYINRKINSHDINKVLKSRDLFSKFKNEHIYRFPSYLRLSPNRNKRLPSVYRLPSFFRYLTRLFRYLYSSD